ncbi:hypothetical protein PYCCODRAFT_483933 [Trametes coccinea BRFM310]|uniref:Uncharacterized protein n=1 Tax=Trametes coccinea (strain BRFM310) TaxID=1353009 RepID=A0A1Y2ILL8_TRAC3|nr:hypothetical protein PYCCODRAFT_483933 [Trametes coccinea BRFM310]
MALASEKRAERWRCNDSVLSSGPWPWYIVYNRASATDQHEVGEARQVGAMADRESSTVCCIGPAQHALLLASERWLCLCLHGKEGTGSGHSRLCRSGMGAVRSVQSRDNVCAIGRGGHAGWRRRLRGMPDCWRGGSVVVGTNVYSARSGRESGDVAGVWGSWLERRMAAGSK